MSLSLLLALLWALAANIAAMIPARDQHWRRAYLLIATGLPLLAFVAYENGVWIGLVFLAAGMSVLRWPLRYLWRWGRARILGDARRGG